MYEDIAERQVVQAADEQQQSETLEARKIIDAQKKSLASQKQAIGEKDPELKSALEKAQRAD